MRQMLDHLLLMSDSAVTKMVGSMTDLALGGVLVLSYLLDVNTYKNLLFCICVNCEKKYKLVNYANCKFYFI